jgi:hypothetical protein
MEPCAAATRVPDPDAADFIRFCYRRRRVGWPELYDEMSSGIVAEEQALRRPVAVMITPGDPVADVERPVHLAAVPAGA